MPPLIAPRAGDIDRPVAPYNPATSVFLGVVDPALVCSNVKKYVIAGVLIAAFVTPDLAEEVYVVFDPASHKFDAMLLPEN